MKIHKFIKAKIRHIFLAGIIVILPAAITFWLIQLVYKFLGSLLTPQLSKIGIIIGVPIEYNFIYPIISILIIISGIFFVGVIATNYLGKKIVKATEFIIERIPIVSNIYVSARQIIHSISLNKNSAFRKVILIEYPRKGVYSIGFLTSNTSEVFNKAVDNECVNVFIPTTPNPTSGMLIVVPKKDIIPLDLSVEEGIKVVISAGIVNPGEKIQIN